MMKALTYHDRRGPAVVFLPPKGDALPESAAAPGDASLNAPAYTQVASRGAKASWAEHSKNLAAAPPYAGRWTVEDVPDGSTAQQALYHVRGEHAMQALNPTKVGSSGPGSNESPEKAAS